MRFNSILVRLKDRAARLSCRQFIGFNSILVRLKGNIAQDQHPTATYRFQFHTGSIKSGSKPLAWRRIRGFNSILVRLKDNKIHADIYIVTGFNSILVRLKGRQRDFL